MGTCIFVCALFKLNSGCTCWPRSLMAACPRHTNTNTHSCAHTHELAGEKCSDGPCSESRFAQAVCTGNAPDYSYSHCDWVQRGRGEKIEHFMEKSTDKKSKLSQGKRANITELRVKKKTLTQQSEEIRKNGGRNGRRRGRKHREAMLGFILWPLVSIRGEFVINGFSQGHGITHHFPVTFFPICWLVAGLIPVQGCGCLSAHTAGHGRQ